MSWVRNAAKKIIKRRQNKTQVLIAKDRSSLRWCGQGLGFEHYQKSKTNYLTVQFFNSESNFLVSVEIPTATHEVFLNRREASNNFLLFREQYDFRIPSCPTESVAQSVAAQLVKKILESAPPRMLGKSYRSFSGKLKKATDAEINQYWNCEIQSACEELLQEALYQNSIPRTLYEMDRNFYLQSYPP